MMKNKERKKRFYEPIWEHLKQHGECFIPAKNASQNTLIRGVIKEKFRDEEGKAKMLTKLQYKKLKHGVEFSILANPKIEDF